MDIKTDLKIPLGSIAIESGLKFQKTTITNTRTTKNRSSHERPISNANYGDSEKIGYYLYLLLQDSETVQEYLRFFTFTSLYNVYHKYYSYRDKSVYSLSKQVTTVGTINDTSIKLNLTNINISKGEIITISRLGTKDISFTIKKPNSNYSFRETVNRVIGGCDKKVDDENIYPAVTEWDLFEFILHISELSIDHEDSPDWMFNYLSMMDKLVNSSAKGFKKTKTYLQKVYYDNKMNIEQPTNDSVHYTIKGLGKVNCISLWHMVENISSIEKYRKFNKAY